jgi:hypothetical protein
MGLYIECDVFYSMRIKHESLGALMAILTRRNILAFVKATVVSCGLLLANQYAQSDVVLNQILGQEMQTWDILLNCLTGILVTVNFAFHFIPDHKYIVGRDPLNEKQATLRITADLA